MLWAGHPTSWLAFLILTLLEIILGVDNIIFISILVGGLPTGQRDLARRLGLLAAMVTRLLLLLVLFELLNVSFVIGVIFDYPVTIRCAILMFGGLFLLYKATQEIHIGLEGKITPERHSLAEATFKTVIIQIALLDIVFSLDSVITAFGVVNDILIMACAIIASVVVMLKAAKSIGEFVDQHPTIRMLALAFLIVIGLTLILESIGINVPKGYIYFAIFFSLGVEMLNIRMQRNRQKSLRLYKRINKKISYKHKN
ncbi:MAG: TerC family protein [Proteobacteria bacterium]|nr:TerC family protein [Pseudomonadota bacterium]